MIGRLREESFMVEERLSDTIIIRLEKIYSNRKLGVQCGG